MTRNKQLRRIALAMGEEPIKLESLEDLIKGWSVTQRMLTPLYFRKATITEDSIVIEGIYDQ